jgi:uncharacterized protein (TIGR03084 family)
MDVADVRADLIAEQQALDAIASTLDADQWSLATPSPGWSVADQIGHLTYFDGTATMAITDPDAFAAHLAELFAEGAPDTDDATLGEFRRMQPEELLEAWRANRSRLADAAAGLSNDDRVVWYGPSMGSKSFLTARLMETWAHGQDVIDAVGAERAPTDRLRHIAQLGFITRGWSYANRGREAPATPVRVELVAPSGAHWNFGPDDAEESVSGPAVDFCLVVTQRRHIDDTDLMVSGDAAREWMELAQAFAGGPTDGPGPSAEREGAPR